LEKLLMSENRRNYDKGEKRYKHEGHGPAPEIRFYKDDPKRFVGMCPAGMPLELRRRLLNEAIPGPTGDRYIEYPKYLYVVHEGTIYEARTSDAGTTYHGFPYKGKLSKELLRQLRQMAELKDCGKSFEEWVKRYISVQGKK
jgi:hypothetical protein